MSDETTYYLSEDVFDAWNEGRRLLLEELDNQFDVEEVSISFRFPEVTLSVSKVAEDYSPTFEIHW